MGAPRPEALLALLLLAASSALAQEPRAASPLAPPETGKPLYQLHCLPCHGEKGQGDGKAAVYLYPKPRDFSRGLFKVRTTPSGSLPSDQDLFDTIGRGLPGSAMPSFADLPARQRWSLVSYLKTLVEVYQYRQPEPPVRVGSQPPQTKKTLAQGQEMYRRMECFKCHGESGRGDGPSAAELVDDWDIPIKVRDFTDGTYKGGPTDRDLYLRFTTGMTGTPMPAYSDDKMTNAERWALVHYVQSVRRADRPLAKPPAAGLLEAARATAALPADPLDPAWRRVTAVDLPLEALWQRTEKPSQVSVRALHDDREIAFLLEWRDPRPDTRFDRTEAFRDAAALQFALAPEGTIAFVGMGHQQGPVNIWHWKSDWQAEAQTGYPNQHSDYYPFRVGFLAGREAGNAFSAEAHPTPVENLVAFGFGTLAPQKDQTVRGQGVWSDGRWHVVLRRQLKAAGPNDVVFAPGRSVPFAVACWDGGQGDRNGQKMVSSWYRLRLGAAQVARAKLGRGAAEAHPAGGGRRSRP